MAIEEILKINSSLTFEWNMLINIYVWYMNFFYVFNINIYCEILFM